MAKVSEAAGKRLPDAALVDVAALVTAYFTDKPDPGDPVQRVAFGTSGHRGSALARSFNEAHIVAITQAIADYRHGQGIDGPLFVGIDTHALSRPALASTLEVLAANGVETMIDAADGYTPTPVISHAILSYNRGRERGLADGIVVTPSHNPPEDGGFKYNPPNGGPADTDATGWIEKEANRLIAEGLGGVKRMPLARALASGHVHRHDYIDAYTSDLAAVIEMDAIREAGVSIGIDPLGGAALAYWQPIIERYDLNATLVSEARDPTFRFMTADWDGRIRMDCSSPYAMVPLIGMRERFDVAFANDTDADRHGIVCRSAGLMNPNHYLAAAIDYLFGGARPGWPAGAAIGKTMVSSAIIDRVASDLGRALYEVPVGFKWFVDGLVTGRLGFGGEESAGASFLRRDGTVWTTDKDGIILGLLAAEMTARTGRDPGERFQAITERLGRPSYARIDQPADRAQKAILKNLTPERIRATDLAGDKIEAKLAKAPGNGAAFGGIKVTSANGWFAARPSGTEEVYKIYAESFRDEAHLAAIQAAAATIVGDAFAAG